MSVLKKLQLSYAIEKEGRILEFFLLCISIRASRLLYAFTWTFRLLCTSSSASYLLCTSIKVSCLLCSSTKACCLLYASIWASCLLCASIGTPCLVCTFSGASCSSRASIRAFVYYVSLQGPLIYHVPL